MNPKKLMIPIILFVIAMIGFPMYKLYSSMKGSGLFEQLKESKGIMSSIKDGSFKDGSFMPSTPVLQSGLFSDDGTYFIYSYNKEVEMPDVKGSIRMQGFSYPAYFQVINTKTGKKESEPLYETEKGDQLYVVWTEGNLVWLSKYVSDDKERFLGLYDFTKKTFVIPFGELEKKNPSVLGEKMTTFYVNNTDKQGLIVEGKDKRFYRIDPKTGKAEVVQGKFESLNFDAMFTGFQISNTSSIEDFNTRNINGRRESIVTKDRNQIISEDDFLEVSFLTLDKNKKDGFTSNVPITYYKDNFFVISPMTTDDEVNNELFMLNKKTLKTVWKLQLPQERLKTIIPKYGNERFCLQGDQLFVTNNNYFMVVNLTNGKIVKKTELY